jgi:acyl-CoA reductase-like NAD-dependent aldehyde dehydrogenase
VVLAIATSNRTIAPRRFPVDDIQPVPIGDRRVTTAESIEVMSPFDGSLIGRIPKCGPAEVDEAVAAATRALASPLPAWRRAEILDTAARLLAERKDDFARTIAAEAAKPIKTARIEAARAVSTFTFSATEARKLAGEMVPLDASDAGEGKLGFVLRVPIGVVGAISPFNFPLNLVAHKVAPAIAAGCPVVLKPASQTPFSAIRLAELLLDDCGLPAGWLNVVTGGGGDVGNAIVDHEGIAMITFTGSPPVGWGIRARAPRKRVGLELGNNAPVILEPDGDWKTAAAKIKVAGFSHAGQSCISTQRIYVHRSIADEFVSELVGHVETLHVGDPMDEDTDVSALISTGECERVKSWVDDAVASGATVATGGDVVEGMLRPTVLTDVTPDMKVCSQEVFGPVVGVQAYDTLDEALALANDTEYGLQAAIFTSDLGSALKAAKTLDFGGVLINEVPTWRTDQMPYGGVRDSGNTREGPAYAVREMTEARLVVIQT